MEEGGPMAAQRSAAPAAHMDGETDATSAYLELGAHSTRARHAL
jgi:hypothetical protein